ncbi:MAG: aminopeptidase P family protein [Endomicrobia bacterium]|nr:aminopeptidase P family protein [Endomicrobiia bacterium]
MVKKINLIQNKLKYGELFLVINKYNLIYLTGIDLNGYYLAITKNNVKLLTSNMLLEQVKKFIEADEFMSMDNIYENFFCLLKSKNVRTVFLDDHNISIKFFNILKEKFSNIKFNSIISDMRLTKEEEEIKNIKEAAKITKNVLEEVKKILKPSVTEIQVKNFILSRFIDKGVKEAFDPIVAFDENTSYPHHISTDKKLKYDSLVLVDIGCKYKNYCCDVTRMYNVNKKKHIKNLYFILKDLQQRLIDMVLNGKPVKYIDNYAKEFFKKYGLEKNCLHSTGHGLGIEVHENPRISVKDNSILEENMVVTIEPGIYFSNKFGIRIEDDIVCREHRAENITSNIQK